MRKTLFQDEINYSFFPFDGVGHIFFESGSLGNPVNRTMLKAFGEEWTSIQNIRASCGIGLVLRLGTFGRAELNYCVPLRCKNGDRVQPGLQFGIGVDFS